MKKRIYVAGLLALFGIMPVKAADQAVDNRPPVELRNIPSFYVHIGALGVFQDEGARVRAGGNPVAAADVSIHPDYTFGFEVGAYVTPNIALALAAGIPPEANIHGSGSLTSLGTLGSVTYGPVIVTAQYHFQPIGQMEPYIGIGIAYLIFFNTSNAALLDLRAENNLGAVVQAGANFMLDKHWGVFIDAKKVWVDAGVTARLGSTPINATVKLDPLLINTGLTYKF